MRAITAALLVSFFSILALTTKVKAQSLTVTAQVGDTVLTFEGYSSPNAFITFLENTVVIGTTFADGSGQFSKSFTAQTPGVHAIDIQSTDTANTTTQTLRINVLAIEFQEVKITDLNFPPTIKINKQIFEEKELIVISGYARPGTFVEVEVYGRTGSLKVVMTEVNGYYEALFDAADFLPGDYTVDAELKVDYSVIQTFSQRLPFSVLLSKEGALIVTIPDDTLKNIIPEYGSGKCIYPYVRLCEFDTEGLGYMDIKTAFPRFFLGFIKFLMHPVSNIYDINEDSLVSTEDLSIFLHYTNSQPYQVLGLETSGSDSSSGEIALSEPFAGFESVKSLDVLFSTLLYGELIAGGFAVSVFSLIFIVQRNGWRTTK